MKKICALIIFLYAFPCYTQEQAEGKTPSQAIVRKHLSDRFPNKTGENIDAYKFEAWKWYKQNPLTFKEQKTRPFWVKMTYHGGWYHSPGYQPKDGGFHLVNPFGVWEHDSSKDHLNFRFIWPFNVQCVYDRANNCYWGIHTNPSGKKCLVTFRCNQKGLPVNVKVYSTHFHRYLLTDAKKQAWFKNGWAKYQNGEIKVNPGLKKPHSILSWTQAQQKTKKYYRMNSYVLQEFKKGRWRSIRPPKGIGGPIRSVDQKGDVVVIASNNGAVEWYPKYGITFKLSNKFTEWIRFDKDGRIWMSGLYCFDPTFLERPTYKEFVILLTEIVGPDPIAATVAMRKILKIDKDFIPWVKENIVREEGLEKKAAILLDQCINGKNKLIFKGDSILLKQLLNGKGSAPKLLSIPKKNKETKKFIETDPLILSTKTARSFKGKRLIETPILKHRNYSFYQTGKLLVSRNAIVKRYFKVVHDKHTYKLKPLDAPDPILLMGKNQSLSESLVLLHKSGQRRASMGIMNIDTSVFTKFGDIPFANYYGSKMARDKEGRMILISIKGTHIYYQQKTKGEFYKDAITSPMMPRKGGLLRVGKRILAYRALYDKQWTGKHSNILEFKNGTLSYVGDRLAGHIYNMAFISNKVLMIGTREPDDVLFIDSHSGNNIKPIFDIKRPRKGYYFFISSVHDKYRRFWFYTTWCGRKKQFGQIFMWNGKKLKTIVKFGYPTKRVVLNPYANNMCITDNGLIWVGIQERMLIIDSKTQDYRFFRVFDYLQQPSLLLPNGNWVVGNYGNNPTTFHLE